MRQLIAEYILDLFAAKQNGEEMSLIELQQYSGFIDCHTCSYSSYEYQFQDADPFSVSSDLRRAIPEEEQNDGISISTFKKMRRIR